MLSTKNLIFKEWPAKKLKERYVGPYMIEKIVMANTIKLKLPESMKIHLVVDFSRIVRYRKLVERQKVEEVKLIEVDGVEEWEVKKILNKRKISEVVKYLV